MKYRLLKKIKGVCFSSFTDVDVVRHPLVQEIIRAYAKKEKKQGERKRKPGKLKSAGK